MNQELYDFKTKNSTPISKEQKQSKGLKEKRKSSFTTVNLAITAMLIAVNVVLHLVGTIKINQYMQVSFGYLILSSIGMLFGPVFGGISGFVSDTLKFIIRPTGAYFPGYALNEILAGVIYGLLLYKKEVTFKRVVLTRLIVVVTTNLILTNVWLLIQYGSISSKMLALRMIRSLVMFIPECIFMYYSLKGVKKINATAKIQK